MANCPDGDPLNWLNENWTKLIETVQTLATKYGQEHKANIIGTISSAEARDVLIKNKGSVWHAVTQCIEQRQQAFNTIKEQGNYSREDIVSTLTAHNGNVDRAMAELNRLQMKPFLLKIQSTPQAATEIKLLIENEQPSSSTSAQQETLTQENDASSKMNDSQVNEDKRDILRDIEAIIGSMEEKQSKQTETLLSTIENLVGNMILSHTSRSMSSASSFSGLDHSDHLDRIHVKSPIIIPSKVGNDFDQNTDVETDVKNFVSRHIQDVVPDVAALISKELVETPEQNDHNWKEVIPLEKETGNARVSVRENLALDVVSAEPLESTETVTVSQFEPTEAVYKTATTNDEVATKLEAISVPPTALNEPKLPQEDSNGITTKPQTSTNITVVAENQSETVQNTKVENIPIRNGNTRPLEMASSSHVEVTQQFRANKPRFVVTKSSSHFTQKQIDKRRIRELEKQLKRQQRQQRSHSMYTDQSDSQSYLSDSTVVADDVQDVENVILIPAVSNEKTFSLSIVEQAALVDDNKEHNQTIVRSPDLWMQPSSSNAHTQLNETIPKMDSIENDRIETVKDVKNRNLSELVEHTKTLIQQMKHEIDEDIAMSASEFGDGENDGYLSDEIYSDEMSDGESVFSDSWEDISDEDSNISDDGEYSVHYDENEDEHDADFQRSSQSVESEFFVEVREHLHIENELIYDGNDENIGILNDSIGADENRGIDSRGSSHSENVGNHQKYDGNNESEVYIENNENAQNYIEINENTQNHEQHLRNEEIDQSEGDIQQNMTSDQILIDSNNNVHSEDNSFANENTVTTASTPESTVNDIIPPADDNLMEHMLEIQQSLHTSSIVSVNFRETTLREKSQSVEPNADPHGSSAIQTPDQAENVPEERTDGEHLNDSEQTKGEEDAAQENSDETTMIEPTIEIPIESTLVEARAEPIIESISEGILEPNNPINDQTEANKTNILNRTENDILSQQTDPSDDSQAENILQTTEELNRVNFISNAIEEEVKEEGIDVEEEEEAHAELSEQSKSIPDVTEHETNESELAKDDDQSQSQSASKSENQVSLSNDTESEMEEISVDVSASDSSASKDDVSIRSSVSTVSVASEKLVESYQYQKITVPVITQCSSSSINVLQLKKNTPEKAATTVKNKIPVRRPSLGEPSASIRNIQNELFNKQLKQPPKFVSKKPSKIVPPKLFFKSTPEASTSKVTEATHEKGKQALPKPSTSSGKQSIPKKKYYETCFSDDNYQTDTDDEKPVTSMKVIPNLVKIVESNIEEDLEVSLMAFKKFDHKIDLIISILFHSEHRHWHRNC